MMTERELCALIEQAEADGVTDSGDFNEINEKLFKYYNSEPFGDEEEDRSSVVTSDVADLVESDMPSLVRIFLSGNDIVEFKPTLGSDIAEAEEKNIYIPWILNNIEDSFKSQHDWLKQILLQKVGVLEYGISDTRKTETSTYQNISEMELIKLISDIEGEKDVSNVEITGQSVEETENGNEYSVDIRITRGKQEFFIENVPNEDLILTRNARSKKDADIVGKRFRKSRGDLIAEGFKKDLVKSLVTATEDKDSTAKQERYKQQGGEKSDTNVTHWANELVEGVDVYVKADFDEDGIPERRHVIKVGNEILENEPFEHVPFSICSALLMPHSLIGKSRGEQALTTQRVQSVLTRNVLDNIYSVNNPGQIINDDVIEMDDLLTQRPNRIVRADGNIGQSYMPLETPYIGDKALQVVQYMDSLQSRRTGQQLAAQGLDADDLHKETATRFEGVADAAAAKTELVARVIAEVGYRDLYEGLAWFASRYQDSAQEIHVLGKPLTVDPSKWRFDHKIQALVGTGAGDNEKTLATLTGIYSMQMQHQELQTGLADHKKVYATLERIIKTSGLNRPERYFNDPEKPEAMLYAENQQLKLMLKQLESQMQDPLSKAEQVKQQGSAVRDQMKFEHEKEMKAADIEQQEKDRQAKIMSDFTKLELEHNTDLPSGAA